MVSADSPAVSAPELTGERLDWINSEPLSLRALRGRLVILDFWTSCCINCIQILPTLHRIETAFPSQVQVIGVHCPKFSAEKKSAHVRAIVANYAIDHPVVNDPEFEIWTRYGIRGWPTLVFISPEGQEIGRTVGEPDADALFADVEAALAKWRTIKVLTTAPPAMTRKSGGSGRLLFPAGLKASQDRVCFLADTGHHQIVSIDEKGQETGRFGSGKPGFQDGGLATASFHSPQGLAVTDEYIIVADTGNHALRRITRKSGAIETLAGDGSRGGVLAGMRSAKNAALASPWDAECRAGEIFFANAGTHQLGVYDIERERIGVLAGSGRESLTDGAALDAALAQPSGLALSQNSQSLYFVDSETSAVRVLSLPSPRKISTLVGSGLFDFGHRNGEWPLGLLQHPLAIATCDDEVLVADTYNDALRILDLQRRTITDLGEGFLCSDDFCLPISHPAGLCFLNPKELLVVDTNNHRILRFDRASNSYNTWFK